MSHVAGMGPSEVMVDPEVVKQVRGLAAQGWGAQVRPNARVLDESSRERAVELFGSAAEGNAVVVQRLRAGEGQQASVRSVQRVRASTRRARRPAQVATVRYETAPGHQVQINFGQKLVAIAGQVVRVYLLVAVLGFSRRIFVKAFLAARQDDWFEGIADGFRHFGGVTRTALGDNDRCLVERGPSPLGLDQRHGRLERRHLVLRQRRHRVLREDRRSERIHRRQIFQRPVEQPGLRDRLAEHALGVGPHPQEPGGLPRPRPLPVKSHQVLQAVHLRPPLGHPHVLAPRWPRRMRGLLGRRGAQPPTTLPWP